MSRARPRSEDCPYVTRGGLKLRFALDEFGVDVAGKTVADLGSHIGGFADCLLQAGAAKVYSVDTAKNIFDWQLRHDDRVVLHEKTNALHWRPPEPVDLVTYDVGWTRQRLILPAAAEMLKPDGLILALVKPQYEVPRRWLRRGVLPEDKLPDALAEARNGLPATLRIEAEAESPHRGSGGNIEVWWLVRPAG